MRCEVPARLEGQAGRLPGGYPGRDPRCRETPGRRQGEPGRPGTSRRAHVQRRLPLAAGDVARHPAQEAPARRRGAHHPGRRGHAYRAHGRRRQDIHRHHRHARAQAPRPRPQADDRGSEQPHRAVGRRLPQALPRRKAPRPHRRGGEKPRLGAPVLGAGRRGRLGRGDRRLQPLRKAPDVLRGAEGGAHGAHRRARGVQAAGAFGRRRREGLLGQADRGRARQVQEQAQIARGPKRLQEAGRRDVRGGRLRRDLRRRGPLLQEPRGVRRLGARHADQRRGQVRGPSDEVRVPARQRARQQHRVRHGNARHEHDGRALQHAALPLAEPAGQPGGLELQRVGQDLRRGHRDPGAQARGRRPGHQATLREVPEPPRAHELVPLLQRHHDRRRPRPRSPRAREPRGRRPGHARTARRGRGAGGARREGPRRLRPERGQHAQDHRRRQEGRARPEAALPRGRPRHGAAFGRQGRRVRAQHPRYPRPHRGRARRPARVRRLIHARLRALEHPGRRAPPPHRGRRPRVRDRLRDRRQGQVEAEGGAVREGAQRRHPHPAGLDHDTRHRDERADAPGRDPRPRLPVAAVRPRSRPCERWTTWTRPCCRSPR